MSALERRYRRLLAWYPADHRGAHVEEMIGVLLAAASDGQRHPRLSDALDLIRGGLRIRLRLLLAGRLDTRFADALAVYSVAVPVMWFIGAAMWVAGTNYRMLRSPALSMGFGPLGIEMLYVALVLIPVLLAWRGRRRAAVLITLVPAILATLLAYRTSGASYITGGSGPSLLLMLEALALAISPGTRRGVQLLSKRAWVVVFVAGIAAAVPYTPQTDVAFQVPNTFGVQITTSYGMALVPGAVGVILVGLFISLPTPIATRFIALLAAPMYLYAISVPFALASDALISWSLAIVYIPGLALIMMAAVLAWLGRRRQLKPAG
ncbi:MAG: hypothetical protein LBV34_22235 [Nocardiopsaceae bacterium]|nr:hypothetical protein [Nocardiopsaceae bacterium]